MNLVKKRVNKRSKKCLKIRSKISGTSQKPRLAVYRSLKHIYVQAIDDKSGKTLANQTSLEVTKTKKNKVEMARAVGELLGKKLMESGVSHAVFDRRGYLYHGRVKEVAEGVRASGIKF